MTGEPQVLEVRSLEEPAPGPQTGAPLPVPDLEAPTGGASGAPVAAAIPVPELDLTPARTRRVAADDDRADRGDGRRLRSSSPGRSASAPFSTSSPMPNPALLAAGYAVAVVTILHHGVPVARPRERERRSLRRTAGASISSSVATSSTPHSRAPSAETSSGRRHWPSQPEQRVPAAASVVLRRLCNFPGMIVICSDRGRSRRIGDDYAAHVRLFAFVVVAGGFATASLWQ